MVDVLCQKCRETIRRSGLESRWNPIHRCLKCSQPYCGQECLDLHIKEKH